MSDRLSSEFSVHPITLRCGGDLEATFLDDYFRKSLSQVRFGAGMGVFFSAIFELLDYLLIPDVLEQIWFIRFAILCPLLLLLFIITWSTQVKNIIQPVLVAAILLCGFGIIAMTVIAYPPGSYYYYAGLLLVLMWVYTFITARLLYASFARWTMLLVYEFVAVFVNHTPLPVLISNSFFFVSANIIGMLACYQIELYKRRDFWQHSLLVVEQTKSSQLLNTMNDELALASDIQKSLLPPPSISWQGGEVAWFCKPTYEIGGDFYSYHFTNQDRHLGEHRIILVAGVMADKDVAGILDPLLPLASEIIVTAPAYARAASPQSLAAHADSRGFSSTVTASVREAIERAAGKAKTPKDLILITGSFYTIGEARECLGEKAVLGALRESR